MSAFDTLTALPCAVTAGEAVSWTETLADYPASTYAVSYLFAGQTPQDGWQAFTVAGVGSGTSWTFTTGTTYKPGIYGWEKKVSRTSDSVVRLIERGRFTVQPNLSIAPTVTAAAAMLAALQTAITTLTTTVNQSVSFNGQSYTKANVEILLKERVRLQAEVYREQQAVLALIGEANSGQISVGFTSQVGCGNGSWLAANGFYNR